MAELADLEQFKEYIDSLEERLAQRSEILEEEHLEAAIDAQLTDCSSNTRPIITAEQTPKEDTIFDDYVNPNSVNNCLSPYVPTTAEKIAAFISFAGLTRDDLLLDIGCGDGRVCIAAAKLSGCRAAGIDISPLCIAMAKEIAMEEGLDESQCDFYEADATLDPDLLLAESSPLLQILSSATVIFLFTYPTLLNSLVPLLSRLTEGQTGKVRAVVTLTYHLKDAIVEVESANEAYELKLYRHVRSPD